MQNLMQKLTKVKDEDDFERAPQEDFCQNYIDYDMSASVSSVAEQDQLMEELDEDETEKY